MMNRKLLALAVGAVVSMPMAANAAPTIYGLVNLSVDRVVDLNYMGSPNAVGGERGNDYEVTSNSSRLGAMGEESLGGGLSAVYKLEAGVDASSASSASLSGRDRYAGLKSDFGTVKLGAYDSPLKQARGPVDVFYDMRYTDVGNFIDGQNRLNKVIGYDSPLIANAVSFKLALQPGENAHSATGKVKNGIADGVSASATYDASGVFAALAYDHDISQGNTGSSYNADSGHNTVRLTGAYTIADALQLGLMLQSSKMAHENVAGKDDQKSALLSVAYSLDKQDVIKAQIVRSEDKFDPAAATTKKTTTFYGVGYDHNFTKMTKAYVLAANAKTKFTPSSVNEKGDVVSVGMQTKF